MTTPTMPHTQWRSSPDINMEGNMSLDLTETQGNTGNPRLLSDNTTSEHGLSGDQAFNHTMYERDDKSERFLTMPAREGSAEPARLAMIEPIHVGESPRDYVHRVALRHKYLTTKLEGEIIETPPLFNTCLEHRDDDGRTPLHHKVVEGDEETAIALVDFGANINAKDNDSQTPLYLAITLDCQDILGRFLWDKQKYAHNVVPLDLTVVTRKQQWTLLHASVNADDEATTETLLEAKLSPNQPDCDQLTPLHIAVKNGSPSYDSFSFSSIVDALLDEGADPTLTTGAGETALDLAIAAHDMRMVIALLVRGYKKRRAYLNQHIHFYSYDPRNSAKRAEGDEQEKRCGAGDSGEEGGCHGKEECHEKDKSDEGKDIERGKVYGKALHSALLCSECSPGISHVLLDYGAKLDLSSDQMSALKKGLSEQKEGPTKLQLLQEFGIIANHVGGRTGKSVPSTERRYYTRFSPWGSRPQRTHKK